MLEADADGPARAVEVVVDSGYGDYAALLGPDGAVVAEAGRLAAGAAAPGDLTRCSGRRRRPAAARCWPSAPRPTARRARRPAWSPATSTPGSSTSCAWPVPSTARSCCSSGDRVVASTLGAGAARDVARAVGDATGVQTVEGWTVNAQPARPGVPFSLIVGVEDARGGGQLVLLALVVVLGVVVAGSLVTVVARGLSQPFSELTEAAERVAQGDLDAPITAGGDEGEAGRLGSAFSQMTDELRRSLRELERSREELRDSLERIGEALTNTHDLDGLLQVVLETALATLGREGGGGPLPVGRPAAARRRDGPGRRGPDGPGRRQRRHRRAGPGRVLGRTGPRHPGLRAAPARSRRTPSPPTARSSPSRCAAWGRSSASSRSTTAPGSGASTRADQDGLATLAGQASIAIDNVQLHQEAQRLSTTDALTGLWNFRYLSMSLAREIERSTRFDRPLAVLMLDLDHFKAVNDAHGHPRGDTVLRELAHRVQEQIREVDTFARYGGEEFVVVLPETTVEGAAQLAERICVAVRREPFRHEGEEPLDITVSIGGAAFPEHGSSPATLMRAADKALYVAKAEGRDRWHMPGV